MKVLICGSRNINDPAVVSQAVSQSGTIPTHIISGGARGVDKLAADYAASQDIEFTEYPADWERYGKRAGFIRNYAMVGNADAVIAVWDGTSPGTKHSIDLARSCGKRVFVFLHEARGAELSASRRVIQENLLSETKYRRQIDHGSVGCHAEHLEQQSSGSNA